MRVVSCVRPLQKVLVWVFGFICVSTFGCQKTYDLNVIASVNGETIWRSELDRLYKAQQSENGAQAERQDQADTERLTILDDLIDQTILQQRAVRMNLMANDEEVDIKLHSMKEQYSETEFTQLLHESYKILKLIARDVAGRRGLDPLVHQEIHDRIWSERSQLLQVAYFQTLRDGSKIENHLAEEILSRGAR